MKKVDIVNDEKIKIDEKNKETLTSARSNKSEIPRGKTN
jgi:hypothetical protein